MLHQISSNLTSAVGSLKLCNEGSIVFCASQKSLALEKKKKKNPKKEKKRGTKVNKALGGKLGVLHSMASHHGMKRRSFVFFCVHVNLDEAFSHGSLLSNIWQIGRQRLSQKQRATQRHNLLSFLVSGHAFFSQHQHTNNSPNFLLYSPLDNAERRLSASSTKCAEGVPGKWTDQVLYIRQPDHCAGGSPPHSGFNCCCLLKVCVHQTILDVGNGKQPSNPEMITIAVSLLQYASFKLQLGSSFAFFSAVCFLVWTAVHTNWFGRHGQCTL